MIVTTMLPTGRIGDPNIGASAAHPWAAARNGSAALAGTAALLLAMMVPTMLAMTLDARVLNGIPVWIKPLKVEFSVAVHLLTIAWLANLLPAEVREGRAMRRAAAALIVAGMFEVLYIALQAARGQASHFNQSNVVAIAMYALMGVGAVTLVAVSARVGVLILRQGDRRDPLVFAAGWGLVLGSVLGGLTGAYLSAQAGHWVGGTPSDAAGLPIFGWSRDGGDLRVAHFAGLHLMQVMPFAAWLLHKRAAPATTRRVVIAIAATGTLLTAAAFAQALAGRPLIGA